MPTPNQWGMIMQAFNELGLAYVAAIGLLTLAAAVL
jgi:hypothetical protein